MVCCVMFYSEEWYIECVGWWWHIAKVKKVRDIAHSICQRLVDIILHMSAAEETHLSEDFFFSKFCSPQNKDEIQIGLFQRAPDSRRTALHPDDVSPGTDLGKRQKAIPVSSFSCNIATA